MAQGEGGTARAASDHRAALGSRAEIINAITRPLGLLVLIALIAEGILALVAARSEGTNQALIIGGMLFALLWLVISATYFFWYEMSSDNNAKQNTVKIAKLIAHVRTLEEDNKILRQNNEILNAQMEVLTSLRHQIISFFGSQGSGNLESLLRYLRIADNDRVRREQVMGIVGEFLDDKRIEYDISRPPGYWRLPRPLP